MFERSLIIISVQTLLSRVLNPCFLCGCCYLFVPGPSYASLTLPSPYDTICSTSPTSAYPTYQQPTYSCLTPYPPTSFTGVSPYQDPLTLASYTTAGLAGPGIPSPDSCLKPELG